jgi:hypothetical protein
MYIGYTTKFFSGKHPSILVEGGPAVFLSLVTRLGFVITLRIYRLNQGVVIKKWLDSRMWAISSGMEWFSQYW